MTTKSGIEMPEATRALRRFRLAPAGNTGNWFLVNGADAVVAKFPNTTSEDEREFIVRAVNSNAELVAALEAVIVWNMTASTERDWTEYRGAVVQIVRRALEKAGAK